MVLKAKSLIKRLLPPIIIEVSKKLLPKEYGFFGDYKSWQEALNNTTSYEAEEILNKVKGSLIKVRDGQAIYERDSVIFNEKEYSYPLLAGLLSAANENEGVLNLIDYGGSLGSTYFQNREFLKASVKIIKWNVIEQRHFVECGKKEFENAELKFYYSIDKCLEENKANVILFSGFLQYLEKPMDFLIDILKYNIKFIIIDRTVFINTDNNSNILTVQKVDPKIYKASYPAWFFNKSKLLKILEKKYKLIAEFDCLDQHELRGYKTYGQGLILKIKESL